MSELTLRTGGPEDLEWLLGLFDEAVAWMVARGQPGQWGTEPRGFAPTQTFESAPGWVGQVFELEVG